MSIKSILYIKRMHDFELFSSLSITSLNKYDYKNNILLLLFKKIRIYIIFVILLISLKNINVVCHKMKVQISTINTYNFHLNFIKKLLFLIYTH